ncbi:PEP-CTERM sorting domain-containing protein [Verrucomicrobiaceae bacterium N1E253]|uniref:PEP-CTERM sorting domain-containing protein n=1 Tax=Oceaniferula marina TaxID=2748318 RepID=A0A851GCT0_9BACT|nr:PEP-CTERM sorting domain-containing protein [Oceaniferula marina]NWK54989.1 PEP-CTERM sorting domain-containing protein [Oceaniferula marina]
MKSYNIQIGVAALGLASTHGAAVIGSDFSDASTFNATGGNYDELVDDLNIADGITTTAWGNANHISQDTNGNSLGTSGFAAKINGNNNYALPVIGSQASLIDNGGRNTYFTITIDANTVFDLTRVDFSWRAATTAATNTRWLAFSTSIEDKVIFSEIATETSNGTDDAQDRSGNRSPNESIIFSDPAYQGLTDTTITFTWHAGGTAGNPGTSDSDFANVVIHGDVSSVPEPSSVALLGLGGLALLLRRRK